MSRPESLQKNLPSLWRILSHFWPQIRKHRLLIVGSWTALLAEVALRLLEPWPLKVIFDTLFARERRQYRVSFYDIFDPVMLLTMAAAAIVAITALRALAAYWNTIGFATAGRSRRAKSPWIGAQAERNRKRRQEIWRITSESTIDEIRPGAIGAGPTIFLPLLQHASRLSTSERPKDD